MIGLVTLDNDGVGATVSTLTLVEAKLELLPARSVSARRNRFCPLSSCQDLSLRHSNIDKSSTYVYWRYCVIRYLTCPVNSKTVAALSGSA